MAKPEKSPQTLNLTVGNLTLESVRDSTSSSNGFNMSAGGTSTRKSKQ
jgi:hypothetical protein